MNSVQLELNVVYDLGRLLQGAGYEQVRIVPTSWLSNDANYCMIYVSYKHYDRITKQIEDKLVFTDFKPVY